MRGAALAGPSNHRLEVRHVPPNHGKSGLEPLVKCWAHDVFTRKSWSCLRHPRKAQTGHQCLNLEEPFHHPTGEPAVIPGHRLGPTRDFLLPAVWLQGDANSPWRLTSHAGLETTAVLSCGSLCQQLPLHFIQTPFLIHRRCPYGQEDAEILRLLGEVFVPRAKRDVQQRFPPIEQITLYPVRWHPRRPCLPLQPSFEFAGETQRADRMQRCAP